MRTFTLPKNCWIFSKNQYVLRGCILPRLPFVPLEHEGILKANGIPYRKVQRTVEVCEYWNPEFGLEEQEFSFPLFASVGDSFRYCERNYSEKAPSKETVEAALETRKFVDEEIENYDRILRDVYLYQRVKQCLSGRICTISEIYGNLGSYFSSVDYIEMNHDKFTVLSLPRTNWVALFDMNKIVPNGYLTLQVPMHIAKYVIGKSGTNIKDWAKVLGVKQIRVIPI